MGLTGFLTSIFGGNRNVVAEVIETIRPNAEAEAQRTADHQAAALAQFAAEFGFERRGWFDRTVDALNRLPRPALAFGTIGLFVSAMTNPEWFAARMQGVALIPEPLWWLMGAIVTFYFGARHQAKSQDFHRSIAETVARAPAPAAPSEADVDTDLDDAEQVDAPALDVEVSAGGLPDNKPFADWAAQR